MKDHKEELKVAGIAVVGLTGAYFGTKWVINKFEARKSQELLPIQPAPCKAGIKPQSPADNLNCIPKIPSIKDMSPVSEISAINDDIPDLAGKKNTARILIDDDRWAKYPFSITINDANGDEVYRDSFSSRETCYKAADLYGIPHSEIKEEFC